MLTPTTNYTPQTNPSGQVGEVTTKKCSHGPKWRRDRECVAQRLLADERYVFFMLKLLYESQTEYEKRTRKTLNRNRRGFDVIDAPRFTKVGRAAVKRGFLLRGELAMCRKRGKNGTPALAKYWRQVLASPQAELVLIKRPPATEGVYRAMNKGLRKVGA
jgi:hypothetical protein